MGKQKDAPTLFPARARAMDRCMGATESGALIVFMPDPARARYAPMLGPDPALASCRCIRPFPLACRPVDRLPLDPHCGCQYSALLKRVAEVHAEEAWEKAHIRGDTFRAVTR